ncbi:PEP-CTERM protein-sorting domain-containing protein [Pustulibacterium marinum]|uniref:PEP-CTERM protein-sorting domain-containing protein n=1 Tax=Pustulibacterium marinum TaxID=1224947 RepID=A0A1I7I353_9FLAO|nr:hypothetical protein [Pustulibacterium marinum]SFU67382.1 PEP-CTERM protein-sorting domain-containing protein [Pustulibacterium marinum]
MKNQLQFYKDIHISELKRKSEIDNSINFPTTLLTLLLGGGFYLFRKENIDFTNGNILSYLIILGGIFFLLSIISAIIFLSRMYLNRFRKYKYLPCSLDLMNRENELYHHFFNFYKETKVKNPKESAIKDADDEFQKNLLNYYIEFGTHNQLVNDGRIKDFYWSRKILILAIIFLAITALLTLLN